VVAQSVIARRAGLPGRPSGATILAGSPGRTGKPTARARPAARGARTSSTTAWTEASAGRPIATAARTEASAGRPVTARSATWTRRSPPVAPRTAAGASPRTTATVSPIPSATARAVAAPPATVAAVTAFVPAAGAGQVVDGKVEVAALFHALDRFFAGEDAYQADGADTLAHDRERVHQPGQSVARDLEGGAHRLGDRPGAWRFLGRRGRLVGRRGAGRLLGRLGSCLPAGLVGGGLDGRSLRFLGTLGATLCGGLGGGRALLGRRGFWRGFPGGLGGRFGLGIGWSRLGGRCLLPAAVGKGGLDGRRFGGLHVGLGRTLDLGRLAEQGSRKLGDCLHDSPRVLSLVRLS
jgi:hypothetical protein